MNAERENFGVICKRCYEAEGNYGEVQIHFYADKQRFTFSCFRCGLKHTIEDKDIDTLDVPTREKAAKIREKHRLKEELDRLKN